MSRRHRRSWLAALSVAAGAWLAGCGGSDDPPPFGGPDSQSGTVAVGSYVADAVVFLDLNDNNVLDSNERRTKTDAQGRYTLTGVFAADLAAHSIVVRIYPESTRVDTGEPAGLDCTLKAAPGSGGLVTPFSTLVAGVVAATPGTTAAAAAARVADKIRLSTLPLTAAAQLDGLRDYVADAASASATSADSRRLRALAVSVAGVLSAVASGLNSRQSVFDAHAGYPFDTLVGLTEGQLTLLASGTYDFSQLDAVQQAQLVSNPGSYPDFFVNGQAMLDAFISNIRVSDLLPDVRDFIVNSDEFKQFFASVITDLISQVGELLLKILF